MDDRPVPVSQPAAQPPAAGAAPAAGNAGGVPALSEAAATLLSNFKAIDPRQEGVGLDKIRPFYPRVGWSKILAPVAELEAAGKLARRHELNNRGGVAFHVYTWQEG